MCGDLVRPATTAHTSPEGMPKRSRESVAHVREQEGSEEQPTIPSVHKNSIVVTKAIKLAKTLNYDINNKHIETILKNRPTNKIGYSKYPLNFRMNCQEPIKSIHNLSRGRVFPQKKAPSSDTGMRFVTN